MIAHLKQTILLHSKKNCMKKILTLALFLTTYNLVNAQTVANVENVFGGTINAIKGLPINNTGTDTFRIIIATQSANSIFYANGIIPATGGTVHVDSFMVLPSASSSAGYGSGIQKIAYHQTSQKIFFIANGNIYASSLTASAASIAVASVGFTDILIKGDKIFTLSSNGGNTFSVGNLDASGNVTITSSTIIAGTPYSSLVAGYDDKLYAFREGTDPAAIQFGGTFTTAINLSSTTIDPMPSLSSSINWRAMNVYTDGTVFVGGNDNSGKQIATASSFNTAYTTTATGIAGVAGNNIDFRPASAGNYYVYFGSAYSTNKGASGSWFNFGNTSFQTHPNDGAVLFARENSITGGVVLLTTDQGLGISKNSGAVITEIDNGINAVQVNDFDMEPSKSVGWLASKTGIRYVTNYNTTAKSWSDAIFPNSDGSPYYSTEMVDADTVYVGNSRVYKTTNRGTSWTQVFTAENAPYNYSSFSPRVTALAVGGNTNEIVMAGYKLYNGARGGVFYSLNNGSTWQQLLINASVVGQDVNVNDIEMTIDSGKVVAYIGVDYDNSTSPIIKGMYKAQWNGTSWSVSSEPIYGAATSLISVNDIHIVSKDTIVAAGAFYNPVLHHEYPIHFAISRTVRNSWTSSVVDTSRVGGYNAVSWSGDTIFYSFSNKIYWDVIKFHSTYTSRKGEALYYSVPIGTEINVLFYDELLAGTETDIRSVRGATTVKTNTTLATNKRGCTNTVISGGSPAGGVYYLVDTTADGYTREVNGEYNVLFAINGVLTGESSSSFANYTDLNAAFSALTLSAFNVVTTYPSTTGSYIIAYADASLSASSDTSVTSVSSSSSIAAITGTSYSCGPMNATSNLYNTTAGGIWSSSSNNIATINNAGKLTVTGLGTTVINYVVTNSNGCTSTATKNFTVSGVPNIQPTTGNNRVCVGSSVQLNNNTSLPVNTTASWSSLASSYATVTNAGLVKGANAGNATIKYTVTNQYGCSSFNMFNIIVNAIPNVPSIYYAPGTINPQIGAPTGNFCRGRTFSVVGSPIGGVWSATGAATITTAGIVTIDAVGAGSIRYNYTNPNGCSNSRTMVGNGYSCAARGVNTVNGQLSTVNGFTMYPNPAKGSINLNVETLIGVGSIVITDLYGKTVKNQALSMGTNTVDIANLSKGMYFVSTITNEGKTTQKLVVE